MKKWFRNLENNKSFLGLLFAVITTASFLLQERLDIPSDYFYQQNSDFVRENMSKKLVFNQFDFTMFIFFCLIGYFYVRRLKHGIEFNRIPWVILSGVYSICMLIGYGFYYAGSIGFYISGLGNILKASIILGGYYIIFYVVLYGIEELLEKHSVKGTNIIKKYCFIKIWLSIFIAWLPYTMIRYPGGINYDAVRQIDYWYGYYSASALANPPLTTIVFGACVALGERIIDLSFGLFLYNLLQAVIMSACFAFVANYLLEKNIKKKWTGLYIILVSLLPIYPIYANVMVKDNLFSMGLMLYTLMLWEMLYSGNTWFDKWKYRLVYFVSIFFMCTFRFNGVYILVVTSCILIIYFWVKKRNYKQIIVSFGTLIVLVLFIYEGNNSLFYRIINNVYSTNREVDTQDAASITSANSQTIEKNVITFGGVLNDNLRSQIARVVCKFEEELSDEDKQCIDLFMDYSKITEVYNPQQLDSVSHLAKGCSAEEKRLFMHTWRKYLAKHPLTYIEAVIHRSYGFFYPGTTNYWNYWGPQSSRVADELQYVMPERIVNISQRFETFVQDMEKLPFIYIMENIGFAFWIILYCIFRLLSKKRWKYLISTVPILVNFGIVLLGPNFYQSPRYGYPQVYVASFLLLLTIMITENSIELQDGDAIELPECRKGVSVMDNEN